MKEFAAAFDGVGAETGRASEGLLFWPRAFRFATRYPDTPGQRQRKEEQRPCVCYPESSTMPPNAGKHLLCFIRVQRTRYMAASYRRTDQNDSRIEANKAP